MTILYLIPHLYNSGGMERVLTQKLNWLCEHTSHRYIVATTETAGERSLTYFPLHEKVEIIELGIDFDAEFNAPLLRKWYQHIRKVRRYRCMLQKLIHEQGIDLVMSMGGKEIAFLRHIPCRTVVETHFAMHHRRQLIEAHHSGLIWSILGKIRVWQLIRDMRGADTLVVLTERDKADWRKTGIQNVCCIPNPCYLPHTIVRHPTSTILAAGRLHPQKGFDRLIEAWGRCKIEDWGLRIVGGGPEQENLLRQSLQSNVSIAFGGIVNNMTHEYEQAGIFVLSSRYEGLPLALIEAMWCGVPCISFDCPTGPRELLADGRGILVENDNIAELAKAIKRLIADKALQETIGQKAKAYARAHYSEEVIMPQWVKIIEQS